MKRSQIHRIDAIFDGCVRLLQCCADRLGLTYKQINVWIFCIIWPSITAALLVIVLLQQIHIHRCGP